MLTAPLLAEGLIASVSGDSCFVTAARAEGIYSLDGQEQDFGRNGKPQTGDADSSGLEGTVGTEHAADYIYGGLASTDAKLGFDSFASDNKLTIQGSAGISFSMPAAAGNAINWGTGSSTANGNTLTVINALYDRKGQYITDSGLHGGFAELQTGAEGKNVTANGNTVVIKGAGTKVKIIVGGGKASQNSRARSDGVALANDNKVFIQEGAHVEGAVYGGQAFGGHNLKEGYAGVSGNTVTIRDAFVGVADNTRALYDVMGAYVIASHVKDTKDNHVIISGSKLTGGHGDEDAKSSVRALTVFADSDPVSTSGNTVDFSNSEIDGEVMGTYISSPDGADVSGTRVTVTGSKVGGYVMGDFVYTEGGRAAAQSTVTVSDSTVGSVVYGGHAYSAGSGMAEASGNEVTLTNTSVGETVMAGLARNKESGDAAAENNVLTIRGGTYAASIYGGYAQAVQGTATAGGNTVTLQGADITGSGSPAFSAENTVIWGSRAAVGKKGETEYAPSSANTLNFVDAKGMTAANIRNFGILSYTLPNMRAQESVLTLTGGADKEKTDISGASVKVAVADVRGKDGGEFGMGGDKNPANDRIILLKNDNGLTTDGWKQDGKITARQGVSLSFELAAATDDTSLYLYRPEKIVDPVNPDQPVQPDQPTEPDQPRPNNTVINPQTKALAEGWLAGLTLGIQSGTVAADQGIGAMRYAAIRLENDGWLPFGLMEGGSLRYNSGSHIDLQSVSLLAGIGRGINTNLGLLIVGGFFEYGTGSYKTHNTFNSMPSVDGSGNAWYMGGGILASMDFKRTGDGHFYLEGSAHTGTLHNSYDGDALRDAYGRSAEFDTDTPYYNLHAGLGYLWSFNEQNSLDLYGKYYWTRVLGTEETLNTGDRVDFDDITSSRTRLGARYSYQASEHLSPYIGAAWEHEFDGVSDTSVFGYGLDAPKIKGDTARGEIGLKFTPTESLPLTIDAGIQGYLGKKDGVTGSVFVQYEF